MSRLAAATIARLGKGMRRALLIAALFVSSPALAVDPPYEPQMEQLAEDLGSLYFLTPLCRPAGPDWRAQMADLIALDQPDEDRQQRLNGAFNTGYGAFSRLYRTCTPSAEQALQRLVTEAEALARDIHARFAE